MLLLTTQIQESRLKEYFAVLNPCKLSMDALVLPKMRQISLRSKRPTVHTVLQTLQAPIVGQFLLPFAQAFVQLYRHNVVLILFIQLRQP